ncbi:MAG: hypothetical protein KatS3mg095_0728 [Candidatus Parcubacteria bacterium]|nr:MAG: hypothetical protein KatS3mg095_0728 [Candidatus Parcubacteria bacterium]
MFEFRILKKDTKTKARFGILRTPHGIIHTPNLAIVATKGSIRGLSFEQAKKLGAEIFMINTFHFFRQERYKVVGKFGGLHKFLNINYPLMTDSGGFQVFSLGFGMEHGIGKVADIFPEETQNYTEITQNYAKNKKNWICTENNIGVNKCNKNQRMSGLKRNLVRINNDGVEFIDPHNGKKLFLSPEISIKVQKILGADIIFSFDECTSPLSDYKYTKEAMKRTHQWAIKCLDEFEKSNAELTELTHLPADRQGTDGTSGINTEEAEQTETNSESSDNSVSVSDPSDFSASVQRNSANSASVQRNSRLKKQVIFGIVQGGEYEDLRKESAQFINSLPFFGFGIGGSLGKSKKDIIKILSWTLPYLNENKPRHLLGIGEIDDIFNSIEQGIDLFDCVIPTRWARHGTGFSFRGRINLKTSKYLNDKKPIDPKCKCNVCQKYSRAYICHLLREKEIYGIMLLTEHNIFWILNLFKEIRRAIKNNSYIEFKKSIIKYW